MKTISVLINILFCTLILSCRSVKINDYYSGFVVDEMGKPISKVLIREYHEDLLPVDSVMTDENGYFKFNMTKHLSVPQLIISKLGYRTDTIRMAWQREFLQFSTVFTEDSSKIVLLSQTNNNIDTVTMQWIYLEGNWILVDFIDNVLKYKTIAKYRTNPLAAESWAFKIVKDSLFTTGLISEFQITCNLNSQNNNDTLAFIKSIEENTYALCYNKQTDKIRAINTANKQEKYTYRRATGKLNEMLSHTPFQWDSQIRRYHVEDSMYVFFVGHLIEGIYEPVSDYKGIQTLFLAKDGSVKGFKQFDTYRIHTYFGTRHPFDDKDVIIFENSKDENGYEVCSWKFSNGKLKLTKMYTPNGGDYYYNGETSYEFIVKTEQKKIIE